MNRPARSIVFSVPGEPAFWERTKGKSRFNSDRMQEAKRVIRERADWAGALPPMEGPVKLTVIAIFGTDREDRWGTWHTQVPDSSNVLKLAEDALSGVAYRDDRQVADSRAVKFWGPEGRTEVILLEMNTDPGASRVSGGHTGSASDCPRSPAAAQDTPP